MSQKLTEFSKQSVPGILVSPYVLPFERNRDAFMWIEMLGDTGAGIIGTCANAGVGGWGQDSISLLMKNPKNYLHHTREAVSRWELRENKREGGDNMGGGARG